MNNPLQKTKVVIRHLPPSLSQSDLCPQIDDRFSNRYNWFCFCPSKPSHQHQRHSRAYINFKRPEDVFDFAQFFDGHVFVNEKGAQFKTIVEYAPSQRVPKPLANKDFREGTIYKDPDYLKFLKLIAKPVENLPSAEIQLERKEAEQLAIANETPIVTPLMEFVRKKRASEVGTQGSLVVKISRRVGASSVSKPGSSTSKQGSKKKMYILKDSAKNTSRKDKSTRQEDQPATSSGKEMSENETICRVKNSISGFTLTADSGKKKILPRKGKEQEIPIGAASPFGNSTVSTARRQNQRHEASGRLIRGILLNNDEARKSNSSKVVQPQPNIQKLNLENGKQLPRPITTTRSGLNGHISNSEPPAFRSDGTKSAPDVKFMKKDLHGLGGTVDEKQEKRARNKDRPDHVVWRALHRSDVSLASGTHGEMKEDLSYGSRPGEVTVLPSGRNSSSMGNGSQRHHGPRVVVRTVKDDGSLIRIEGKSFKRGVATGSASHEKKVWVQKSSSGS